MSFNLSGLDTNITSGKITIEVADRHPLIQLGQSIPWAELVEIVTPDLKKTKKGGWFLGRPLNIRIHLGAYFLQKLFNMTDRMTEYGIKDNAAYQIFCGRNVVDKWRAPDHTKIERFRSRLSPETQRELANWISKLAVKLGFASPKEMDIDSTIQDANMSYPSDANLMVKLAVKSNHVLTSFKEQFYNSPKISIAIIEIKNKARAYFFQQTKKR
jgi:IS5 family transposase